LLKEVEHWPLTTLREKLVKIGAKVVSGGRYVTFQLAEVAAPRALFRKFGPSVGCGAEGVSSTVVWGYDLRKPGGHLGNSG
jgi:hypothetical protein